MLLGALALKHQHWMFPSDTMASYARSLILLAVFTVPTAQLLLTLVISQDMSYTTFVLLLVVGYSMMATTADSLMLYLTVTLALWAACALRCPQGAWVGYVLPWAAAAGLALLIQYRQRLATPATPVRPKTSSVIDIDLHIPLREAIAERDRFQSLARHLDVEVRQLRQAAGKLKNPLPFIHEATVSLTQEATLQEVGRNWLSRLISEVHGQKASLWLKQGDNPAQLVVSTHDDAGHDDVLLADGMQGIGILQRGNDWACPIDLGLAGKGVLLVHGTTASDHTSSLLQTAAASLTLFLRWQLAEAECDSATQEMHQHREQSSRLQSDLVSLETTHRQMHEHLRGKWEEAVQALENQQATGTGLNEQLGHWKSEAQRFQKLVETAQAEHDTLNELLDETEKELKDLKAKQLDDSEIKVQAARVKSMELEVASVRDRAAMLEQKLHRVEADLQSAESNWDAAEKQLQQAQAQLQKAQDDAAEAHAAWEEEMQSAARLTLALVAMPDVVALFDTDGGILLENDQARRLRGNGRNKPGEHPLWKSVMTDELFNQNKPWRGSSKLADQNSYHITMQPLMQDEQTLGYAIIAQIKEDVVEVPEPVAPVAESLAGARFFGGLAQTLEPPLSLLIKHADSLLDTSTDHHARRNALLGILQQGRYVRNLLEQACDYAHLESGKSLVMKASCSPWLIAQQVVSLLRPGAEEKGLTLFLQPMGAMPTAITSDAGRLTSLLKHLLNQAIRTSQSGSVFVNIGLSQEKPSQTTTGQLRIEVKSGETVDQPQTPGAAAVMEFKQSMLRRQALSLGGELALKAGSNFTLTLPVTAAEMVQLTPMDRLRVENDQMPDIDAGELLRGQALIVIDDKEQQRVVTYQLERLGLRCEVITDPQQVVNRINEDWFDLVLWDAFKRDMPAPQAAQMLKSHFYRGSILAVGTPEAPHAREEFLANGGDALLPTPIVPAIWRNTLAGYLPKKNDEAQEFSETIVSDFHADRNFLTLVNNYVGQLPSHLADMRASLQVADLARLARLCRALNEGGKLYGYPLLSSTAQKLERLVLQGRDAAEQTILLDQLGATIRKIEAGMKQSRSDGYLALPGPLTKAA